MHRWAQSHVRVICLVRVISKIRVISKNIKKTISKKNNQNFMVHHSLWQMFGPWHNHLTLCKARCLWTWLLSASSVIMWYIWYASILYTQMISSSHWHMSNISHNSGSSFCIACKLSAFTRCFAMVSVGLCVYLYINYEIFYF